MTPIAVDVYLHAVPVMGVQMTERGAYILIFCYAFNRNEKKAIENRNMEPTNLYGLDPVIWPSPTLEQRNWQTAPLGFGFFTIIEFQLTPVSHDTPP